MEQELPPLIVATVALMSEAYTDRPEKLSQPFRRNDLPRRSDPPRGEHHQSLIWSIIH
jgi:hypothetical protein